MNLPSEFFTVHRDLPREGPGLAEDVVWAAHVAEVPQDGRVCDAGCGPGGDLAALRKAVPAGRVDGFEQVAHFVEAAQKRFADDPAITVVDADMAGLTGPYDMIWSAGAVYFLGVGPALTAWRRALTPNGAIVFSHPCHFVDAPSDDAVAFWEGEPVASEAATRAEIFEAGFGVIGARRVTDDGWNAYYGPLLARCDALEDGASEELLSAIADARREATEWRNVRGETGYMLFAVRPQ